MTLETFDGKKTGWEGLWYQPDAHIYASMPLTLSDLRQFKGTVKILVRKNKFYVKDTKRPNYQFCICDSRSEKQQSFRIMRAVSETFGDEAYIRLDEAVEVARQMLRDMQYGYSYDDLSVEVVGLMQEHAVTPSDVLEAWENQEEGWE